MKLKAVDRLICRPIGRMPLKTSSGARHPKQPLASLGLGSEVDVETPRHRRPIASPMPRLLLRAAKKGDGIWPIRNRMQNYSERKCHSWTGMMKIRLQRNIFGHTNLRAHALC